MKRFWALILTLLMMATMSCGYAAEPRQDSSLGIFIGASRIEPYSELVWAKEGDTVSDGLMSAWSVPDALSAYADKIPLFPLVSDTEVQTASDVRGVKVGDVFSVYGADFSHIKDVSGLHEVWHLYEDGTLSGTIYVYFTVTKTCRNGSWCRGCFAKTDFSK